MRPKTLLVHLNDAERAPFVLAPAIGIARRSNAHLIGFHALAGVPPVPPLAIPYSGKVFEDLIDKERKAAKELQKVFEDMTGGEPFVAEYRSTEILHSDLALAVMDQGRAADLIVTSQRDAAWDLGPILDFPERLALESGRPVLITPTATKSDGVFKTVVIAWNGKREAARAVFDALPMLREAEVVHIVAVTGATEKSAGTPVTEIAAALARHDLAIETHIFERTGESVGDTVLRKCADVQADLLVMGAYGHSRFREFVFGGMTRTIGTNMTLPVLQSH